jgi:hypothetical protein
VANEKKWKQSKKGLRKWGTDAWGRMFGHTLR